MKLAQALRLLIFAVLLAVLPASAQDARRSAADCLPGRMLPGQIVCLAEAAEAADDAELCLVSDDPAVRWMCVARYAQAKSEPAHCAILPMGDIEPAGITRDLCRVQLAVALSRPDLCEGLLTAPMREPCYLQLVQEGGDVALCDNIANEILNTACRET